MPRTAAALRGRSDRRQHLERRGDKTSALTTVHKDNIIVEATALHTAALMPRRNDYGKRIRKDYEAHRLSAKRTEIKDLVPRPDRKAGTLTTVTKDLLLLEYEPIPHTPGQPQAADRGGLPESPLPMPKLPERLAEPAPGLYPDL